MKSKQDHLKLFEDMIHRIAQKIPLQAVILFGSQAKGIAHKYSDYDVVIVARFIEDYWDRSAWVMELAPEVSIDLFCYTPEEFDRMFHEFRLTPIDAVGEGIVLFGEDFLAPYQQLYRTFVARGMHKTTCVLIPPQL